MTPDLKKIPELEKEQDFYFETKEEEEAGIKTSTYANGNKIKTVILSNGAKAVIRQLKGRDFIETQRIIQDNKSVDFQTANMARAITINGETAPPEYYLDDLYQEDYSTLLVAYGSLNFRSATKKSLL